MKAIAVLSLLLLVLTGSGARAETGVLAYLPVQFEFANFGCDSSAMASQIIAGAARLRVDTPFLRIQGTRSDNPYRWTTDLKNLLYYCPAVFIDTHGSTEKLMVEGFTSTTARDTRLAEYENVFGIWDVAEANSPTAWGIGITKAGIENWLKPQLQPSTALVVTACNSYALMNSWGTFSTARKGSSYLCYDYS